MNIIEVSNLPYPTYFTGSEVKRIGDKYWYFDEDGELLDQNAYCIALEKSILLATDYELYEEIRPKEAGEVWSYRSHEKFMTFLKGNSETLWARNITLGTEHVLDGVVHDKDHWTREHPPVEDERVEIVAISHNGTTTELVKSNGSIIAYWGDKGKLIFIPNK